MSSDEDDDLFADSGDDTDDLIAQSQVKPVAKKKKIIKKKSVTKKRKLEKPIPGTVFPLPVLKSNANFSLTVVESFWQSSNRRGQ